MSDRVYRQPHAVLDPVGRRIKAEKIRRLLELNKSLAGLIRVLEIGTGSGAIASYFASLPDIQCEVDAVDVLDQRSVTDGYRFQKVDGVKLPFDDESFDIVISNHVIEHVGNASQQMAHLGEIARVLSLRGVAYLASPNRWQLVEPHYRLVFLSWLPRPFRSFYLRVSGKGDYYDCEPLQMKPLEAMIQRAGLRYQNICVPALRYILEVEKPRSALARLLGYLPDSLFENLRRVCPTHIYLLVRRPADHD